MVLDTPMPLVDAALAGRFEMLRAIFGGGDSDPGTRQSAVPVASDGRLDRPEIAKRTATILRALAARPAQRRTIGGDTE